MPELAEVEFYRKQWDPGLGARVLRMALHAGKRAVRDIDPAPAEHALVGATLLDSTARAKQMLFRFGPGGRSRATTAWLGVHLGMTGELRLAAPSLDPGRHDHLVLFTRRAALVFSDPRMFGRVQLHLGSEPPPWWVKLPPDILSADFTLDRVQTFCQRRARTPVKALLLMQEMFPGIGNWMADEILWRAGIDPRTPAGELKAGAVAEVWQQAREVCQGALDSIGEKFGDPPPGWFFHVRWTAKGRCPKCDLLLETASVGGRTTRWCKRCQPARRAKASVPR